MGDRTVQLAATVEDASREVVEFFAALDPADLRLPCADPSGGTVGAVLHHLDDGYDMALAWLRAVSTEDGPAPVAHQHDSHDNGDAAAQVERLRRGGETWTEMVRGFTDVQLDRVPPATEGITDGTKSLADVVLVLVDHQMAHLGHARQALADRAGTP